MTHGFWADRGAQFARFKNDVMPTHGKRVTKWEILTSPDLLMPDHYLFLGKAMRWGRPTGKHSKIPA